MKINNIKVEGIVVKVDYNLYKFKNLSFSDKKLYNILNNKNEVKVSTTYNEITVDIILNKETNCVKFINNAYRQVKDIYFYQV